MPADPLLRVRDLSKTYFRQPLAGGAAARDASRWPGSASPWNAGRTLAVIGASGSGKSTLARCLTQFETPTGGEILFEGRPLSAAPAAGHTTDFPAAGGEPESALHGRRDRGGAAGDPARRHGGRSAASAPHSALELTGIARAALGKRAHEFSGGERQRLAIARALVAEPKVLILDESFNGLDASLAAQIAALLTDLQERLGVAYILISHDLTLVAGLADEIAVMERGTIVEHGACRHADERSAASADARTGGGRRGAGAGLLEWTGMAA